ncbi:hypothetical protein TWF569_007861 [Orbilia oligospora]|uniref:Uncharacterized protein n=1 Tax=Orbilia oligospora TaxID=2813651 RepID=A0A7C8IYD9_ORBOL|nr:hypothetical protein TWF102_006213 [Orbilia oligospora]KAF3079571.1 hypothetical protein TWF706_003329 [Orbilia oligospora]KAF3080429.1 hypothetical protein TWF103_004176 [Orbilia oligospora]KAF3149550.1 hypothetical protein TWF594_010659 [Orbilia oligospora]KAF3155812.1 hypothetical protein TWF569_007861 [Orbilia oligospora]
MHFKISAASAVAILASIHEASAHCRIIRAIGNAGGDGRGLLSRWNSNGLGNDITGWASENQCTIFSDPPIQNWPAHRSYFGQHCGVTLETVDLYWRDLHGKTPGDWWARKTPLGQNSERRAYVQTWWETQKQANDGSMAKVSLKQNTEHGQITIWILQVNADGAGPFRVNIDPNGDGNYPWGFRDRSEFTEMGFDGPESVRYDTVGQLHVIKWNVPKQLKCYGKSGNLNNVCIIRIENMAKNGPFGGCLPIQIVDQAPDAPPPAPAPEPDKPAPEPPKPHVYVIDKPVVELKYADPPSVNYGNSAYYKRSLVTGEMLEKRNSNESGEDNEKAVPALDGAALDRALSGVRKEEKKHASEIGSTHQHLIKQEKKLKIAKKITQKKTKERRMKRRSVLSKKAQLAEARMDSETAI